MSGVSSLAGKGFVVRPRVNWIERGLCRQARALHELDTLDASLFGHRIDFAINVQVHIGAQLVELRKPGRGVECPRSPGDNDPF